MRYAYTCLTLFLYSYLCGTLLFEGTTSFILFFLALSFIFSLRFWDRAPAVFQIPQAYRLVGAAFCFLESAARFARCAASGSGRIKESEGGR